MAIFSTYVRLKWDFMRKDKQEGGIEFTPEFLNSIEIMPPHELKLKKNTIIMLMRNLDISEGMCNGTPDCYRIM